MYTSKLWGTWSAGSLWIWYMGMIIESSNQREKPVWESEYMLLSQVLSQVCPVYHKLLVTVGEHAMAWQGNQKSCAALAKTGHCVQAMKQAVLLIERVNREIFKSNMINLNQTGFWIAHDWNKAANPLYSVRRLTSCKHMLNSTEVNRTRAQAKVCYWRGTEWWTEPKQIPWVWEALMEERQDSCVQFTDKQKFFNYI